MDTLPFRPVLVAAYTINAFAIAMIFRRWTAVRGTTLVGPWCWLLASLAVAFWGVNGDPASRLIASTLTLCPAMSLFGAKRPQDKPWHFIVASLWLILSLPAIQALLFARGGVLEMHAARSWFLAILVACGMLNSLFGRYWQCVLLGTLGQLILLSPFLPPAIGARFSWNADWGLVCFASAVVLAATWPIQRRGPALDSLWRDFRDAFGLVWALRLIERINANARANGWDIVASWSGFRTGDGKRFSRELPPEQMRAFRQNLANLLRRFVSEDWIARRLDPSEGEFRSD